jgi:hypothetical protein
MSTLAPFLRRGSALRPHFVASALILASVRRAAGGTFALSDGFGLPQSLSVATSSDTVYQGVSGFSALAAGTFVDTDGAIESDGSLLATRIAVEDPLAVQVQIGRCYTPRLPSLLLCFGHNSSKALAWM